MSIGYPSPSPFTPQFSPQPRRSGSNWLVSLLLVGVGVLLIGGVLLVGGIWYVTANVDRWLVALGREAIVAMIEESEIPASEKSEVVAQVDRVVAAYKERKIGQADLERVLNELSESPAMTVISLYGIDESFLADSGLPEDEIARGRRTFQRVLRGIYEGKITEGAFYAALPNPDNRGAEDDPRGDLTLASLAEEGEITEDDLRRSLVKLQVMADNAQIPNEPFQLDIGDEIKRIVDRALAGKDSP
jgi:hypothetical protein